MIRTDCDFLHCARPILSIRNRRSQINSVVLPACQAIVPMLILSVCLPTPPSPPLCRSGEAVEVRYADIPFERMCTTDIVEGIVRAVARGMHQNYATSKMPPDCVGAPTYFASHAVSMPFTDCIWLRLR